MGDKMNRAKSIVQVTSALLIMMGIIHATMTIKSVAPNVPAEILQNGAYVLMVLGTLMFIVLSKKSLRDVGLFVGLSNICYTLCRKLFRVSLGDFQPSGRIGKLLYFLL